MRDTVVCEQMQVLALPDDSANSQCHYCISQWRIFVAGTNCSQRH